MRIFIAILLISFLVPIAGRAETKKTPTPEQEAILKKDLTGVLRGFVWGLSRTVILENEQAPFMGEENGTLLYLDYIRGIKSTIAYEFEDDKLWRARIFIEKKYSVMQDRINDLLLVNEDLTRRFGEPVKEEFLWKDKAEKNLPENWGWAVYRGELFITIVWQNKETEVTAYLGAKKLYNPVFNVTYVDRHAKHSNNKKQVDKFLLAP